MMGKILFHRKTNSLLIPTKDPRRVTEYIPRSRHLDIRGRSAVQVAFGLDEARVLRNLGIQAPSPIRYLYDWPSRYPSPMSHQVATAEFLTLYRKAMCLNDPGTGKTLSVLWAMDWLMDRGVIKRAVVTCPKSIMDVWENELLSHFLFKRSCVVVQGSREQKEKLVAEDVDLIIINHDGLKAMGAELCARKDIDLWVVDEASEGFRNASTDRYRSLEAALKSSGPDCWLWLLTGTPTSRAPTDAWAYGRLLGNPSCPKYFSHFRDETMVKLTEYRWVPKPGAYARAFEVMQPGIRFRKEECIDLPPVTFQTHRCLLSSAQDKAFKRMASSLVTEVGGDQITAANAAVKLGKLLQICAGVIYNDDGEPRVVDSQSRLEVCDALVKQTPRKTIIYVPFRACLHHVADYLKKKGHTVATVDGSTPSSKRKEIFGAFQESDHPEVLVAHPRTAAHGLTLTRADTTIWYSPTHSAEHFDQGNSRMDRPGQNFPMSVHMLTAHPVETAVYTALREKQRMQDCILDLYRNLRDYS